MLPNVVKKAAYNGFAIYWGAIRLAWSERERDAWRLAYKNVIRLSVLNRLIDKHWKRQEVLLQELDTAKSEKQRIEIVRDLEVIRNRTLRLVMYRFNRYDYKSSL